MHRIQDCMWHSLQWIDYMLSVSPALSLSLFPSSFSSSMERRNSSYSSPIYTNRYVTTTDRRLVLTWLSLFIYSNLVPIIIDSIYIHTHIYKASKTTKKNRKEKKLIDQGYKRKTCGRVVLHLCTYFLISQTYIRLLYCCQWFGMRNNWSRWWKSGWN